MDRGQVPAPPVQVLWAGRWYEARAGQPFVIGRAPESHLHIDDPDVSRCHVAVVPVGSGWELRDSSRNGTFVGGRRVTSLPVTGELSVTLGSGPQAPRVVIRAGGARPAPPPRPPAPPPRPPALPPRPPASPPRPQDPPPTKALSQGVLTGLHDAGAAAGRLRIGRAPDNDVVLDDLLVSRHHAELRRTGQRWQIVDLGTGNGTFVNGARVADAADRARATSSASGTHCCSCTATGSSRPSTPATIAFEADDLGGDHAGGQGAAARRRVRAGRQRSLLAVVGPSGAGKSTLLRALTGSRPADIGEVRYAGRDLYAEYDELRAPHRARPAGRHPAHAAHGAPRAALRGPAAVPGRRQPGRPRAPDRRGARASSASPSTPTSGSTRCPAGSASAPASRWSCSRARRCCSSTSRRPGSTRGSTSR